MPFYSGYLKCGKCHTRKRNLRVRREGWFKCPNCGRLWRSVIAGSHKKGRPRGKM